LESRGAQLKQEKNARNKKKARTPSVTESNPWCQGEKKTRRHEQITPSRVRFKVDEGEIKAKREKELWEG